MDGNQYATWVGKYILHNFGDRGIEVYREVFMGKSIIGKNRRVDVVVLDRQNNRLLALECKCQNVQGTTDEKTPYTLSDVKAMRVDAAVVYGGSGWSSGIAHMLESSESACFAYADTATDYRRTARTKELDHILAMTFEWWDVFLEGKAPMGL